MNFVGITFITLIFWCFDWMFCNVMRNLLKNWITEKTSMEWKEILIHYYYFLHYISIIKLYCVLYFRRRKFSYRSYFNLSQKEFVIQMRGQNLLYLIFKQFSYTHLKIHNPTFFFKVEDKVSSLDQCSNVFKNLFKIYFP